MIIKSQKIKSKKLTIPNLLRFCLYSKTAFSKHSSVDDYQITGFIGRGSTSRVYQGYNILTKQQVIIKLFKDIIAEQKIIRQIRINQIISQCKYIVPMVDTIRDQGCGSYGIIFQNLHGVPLNQMLGNVDFMVGLKYMKDVIMGLDYIHKKKVIHRDLKKSNILITSKGAKIFDFGLGRIQGVDQLVTKRFGTKCYYTPQVMFKMPHFTYKADIWVCGLIMAQILSQSKALMPYVDDQTTKRQIVQYSGYDQDIVDNNVLKTIKKINIRKLLQSKYSDQNIVHKAAEVIQKMMRINPNQRPTAQQVLKEDLFKNLNNSV